MVNQSSEKLNWNNSNFLIFWLLGDQCLYLLHQCLPFESSDAVGFDFLSFGFVSVFLNAFEIWFHVSFIIFSLDAHFVLKFKLDCVFESLNHANFVLLFNLMKIFLQIAHNLQNIVLKFETILKNFLVIRFDLIHFCFIFSRNGIMFVLWPITHRRIALFRRLGFNLDAHILSPVI